MQIADAYRRALCPYGIAITTIAPGYVNTKKLRDLNHNDLSKKPFLVTEAQAVREITQAITEKKALLLFPKRMKWLMRFLSYMPSFLLSKIMYKKAHYMKK